MAASPVPHLANDQGVEKIFIGVRELSFAANRVNTEFFRPIEGWAAAGLLYLLTAWLLASALRL